jgi:transposase
MPADSPAAGLTVREVARRYRVGTDRVRGWIRRGEMIAINTADVECGKPRFLVLPEALAEFERRRQAAPPLEPARRRRRPAAMIDYYPDAADVGGPA